MAQSNAAQEDVIHPLRQELDLSKYNSGLKLIPEFAGTNWDEFKRKIETQFVIMGIDSYLTIAPRPNISHESCQRFGAQCQFSQLNIVDPQVMVQLKQLVQVFFHALRWPLLVTNELDKQVGSF